MSFTAFFFDKIIAFKLTDSICHFCIEIALYKPIALIFIVFVLFKNCLHFTVVSLFKILLRNLHSRLMIMHHLKKFVFLVVVFRLDMVQHLTQRRY